MRRTLAPVVAALPVLVILLGLGTWQVQRLRWKEDLLLRLSVAETAPAAGFSTDAAPYSRLFVTGRYDHGREVLLGAEVRGGQMGAHLITPMLRPDAPPLLVDRGWVPLERGRAVIRPSGDVTVTGYLRPAEERGWVSATDDTVGRHFYTFAPSAIGQALGLGELSPVGLVELAPRGEQNLQLPMAATQMPRPENPHLGYAATWYGLACTLIGVVAVFSLKRWRETS